MSEDKRTQRPSFSEPIYAFFRQGAKEFAQILPAFPESVRPVEEVGTLGNPPTATVQAAREEKSEFRKHIDRYDSREPEGPKPPEMERE